MTVHKYNRGYLDLIFQHSPRHTIIQCARSFLSNLYLRPSTFRKITPQELMSNARRELRVRITLQDIGRTGLDN